MSELTTRASSINRALDQIGDKWCLLIIQEVLWGINSFNDMMEAMGVSRGVLSNRLKWLQAVGCLRRDTDRPGRRPVYHLTRKSIELYDSALMAIRWERNWFSNPALDRVELLHLGCGEIFQPVMECASCDAEVRLEDASFQPGPGAARDVREKKVRRRSSIATSAIPSQRPLYRNLINLVGDRWTANVIALAFHGLGRFDEFHRELPVATNILADRLRFLVQEEVFEPVAYQQRPLRHAYQLTPQGPRPLSLVPGPAAMGRQVVRPRGARPAHARPAQLWRVAGGGSALQPVPAASEGARGAAHPGRRNFLNQRRTNHE